MFMKYKGLLLVLLFCSCVKNQRIEYKNFDQLNSNCKNEYKGYYSELGVEISNIYYTYRKLETRLNSDILSDSIIILKPQQKYIMKEYKYYGCFNDNDDNLLLIFKNNGNGKHTLWKRYDKVISNKFTPVFNDDIESYKNGFVITGDFGLASRHVISKIYISYSNSDLYIDSIYVEEWGANLYDTTYYYNSFRLNDYKREFLDSLANM